MAHSRSMSSQEHRSTNSDSLAGATAAHRNTMAWNLSPANALGKVTQFFAGSNAQETMEGLKQNNQKLAKTMDAMSKEIRELKEKYEHQKELSKKDNNAKQEYASNYKGVVRERDRYRQQRDACRQELDLLGFQYDEAQRACHELKKKLQVEEGGKSELQHQIAEFKRIISASSQTENQVADDVIRMKSDQIFYCVQDFVVKTFRGAQFDLAKIPQGYTAKIQQFAPAARNLPKGLWLKFVTSLISQIMVTGFGPGNFFGDSVDLPIGPAVQLAKEYEGSIDRKWLVGTRKMLDENGKEALQAADHRLAVKAFDLFEAAFRPAVSIDWTPEMSGKVVEIFRRAHEFYRLLLQQQSQLIVQMPNALIDGIANRFDPKTMQDVDGGLDDETNLSGAPIEISVFPAVVKMTESSSGGDGFVIVAKAKVVPGIIVPEDDGAGGVGVGESESLI